MVRLVIGRVPALRPVRIAVWHELAEVLADGCGRGRGRWLRADRADQQRGPELGEDSRLVELVELAGGVLASHLDEHLPAAGMLVKEAGNVVHLAVDDQPAVCSGIVRGHLGGRQHPAAGHAGAEETPTAVDGRAPISSALWCAVCRCCPVEVLSAQCQ